MSARLFQRVVPQAVQRRARRKLSTTTTTPAKDEGWSLTTTLAIAVASIVVPSGIGISSLRSDPELRDSVRIKFPEGYNLLETILPEGSLIDVTMADLLATKNDWPLEHDLPWGEGYDEDLPPRKAIVTTKRGTKFTVDLMATDCGQSIVTKIIPLGASFDDSVLDVQFLASGNTESSLSSAMAQVRKDRAPVDGLSYKELQDKLDQVREVEQRMKVDKEVWRQMGPSGVGKVNEMEKELMNILREKKELKLLMKS